MFNFPFDIQEERQAKNSDASNDSESPSASTSISGRPHLKTAKSTGWSWPRLVPKTSEQKDHTATASPPTPRPKNKSATASLRESISNKGNMPDLKEESEAEVNASGDTSTRANKGGNSSGSEHTMTPHTSTGNAAPKVRRASIAQSHESSDGGPSSSSSSDKNTPAAIRSRKASGTGRMDPKQESKTAAADTRRGSEKPVVEEPAAVGDTTRNITTGEMA